MSDAPQRSVLQAAGFGKEMPEEIQWAGFLGTVSTELSCSSLVWRGELKKLLLTLPLRSQLEDSLKSISICLVAGDEGQTG